MSLLPSEGVLGEERFHSYWLTDINTHTNTQKNSCELCWLYIDKMHSLLTWTEPLKNLCLISISAKCPPEDKRAPLQKIAKNHTRTHTIIVVVICAHTVHRGYNFSYLSCIPNHSIYPKLLVELSLVLPPFLCTAQPGSLTWINPVNA